MAALGLLIAVQFAAGNSGAAKTTEHVTLDASNVQSIWKPVVAQLAANTRAYALVHDEPDNEGHDGGAASGGNVGERERQFVWKDREATYMGEVNSK